ncbi:hypothetical protein DJ533_06640 [Acinetobacter defluvii]|uniref:Lipoprotein n=2 Tax=Acinetobacter defluvii TaxID=1871111 RepID=A0A2S2FBD4_9GAMM|nr:hypothetical protein DJ533_06640 [Acinetobacter defluvii]
MKTKVFACSALLLSLSACQLISPLVIDYNGVRLDVATYINNSMFFSIADRKVLVEYAKQQQKVLNFDKLTAEQQKQLAYDRAVGRYCAAQRISMKKLNLVDSQIFSLSEHQKNLDDLYKVQATLNFDMQKENCQAKF